MIPSPREIAILIKDVGPVIVPIFQEILTKCTKCPVEILKDPKSLAKIILKVCEGKADPIKVAKIFVGLVAGQGGGWLSFAVLSSIFPGVGIVVGAVIAFAGNHIGSELGKEIVEWVAYG